MEAVLEYNARIYTQKQKIDIHREMMNYTENQCDTCQTHINACSLCIAYYFDEQINTTLCPQCFDEFVITYEDCINPNSRLSIRTFIYGNHRKIFQTCQYYIISNLFLNN